MISIEQYTQALNITIQYAQQQLRRVALENAQYMKLIDIESDILEKVHRIMDDYQLNKKTRRRDVVTMRQALMFWLRKNTTFSMLYISELVMPFSNSSQESKHTNVIHAVKLCSEVNKNIDRQLWEAIQKINLELAGLEGKLNNKQK